MHIVLIDNICEQLIQGKVNIDDILTMYPSIVV